MKFLFIFLSFIYLFAIPPLKEVFKYPHTYFRDFYLTHYLKITHSKQEADKIYNTITYKKKYQLKILAKKFPFYKKIYNCKYPNKNNYQDVNSSCIIKNGFKLSDIKKMNKLQIQQLLSSLPKSKIKTEINIVWHKTYKQLFQDKNMFYDVFMQIMPDINIPDVYISYLSKDKRFYNFLNISVRKKNLFNIQNSLLRVNYKDVSDKDKFLLALNAIHLNYNELAMKILKSKQKKDNQDNFWLYLLTKNIKYADKLLLNKRLDFWTLYMYETFHKKYKINKIKIYNSSKVLFNINNPLDVIKFYIQLSKIKNYFAFAKKLDNSKTLPLKALVLDKANKWQKNYFIMPKYNLKNLNLKQKSLLYAIIRQESRFIPAQISSSYAIGLMQLMPFLIHSFKSKYDISQFFIGNINLKYGKKYMLWLMRNLHNPLFVSYAYNGGIGFTKRRILPYFHFKGEYEPFLSMELVPYSESRKYGMNVLRNYVIYNHLFGGKITLHKLLKKDKLND